MQDPASDSVPLNLVPSVLSEPCWGCVLIGQRAFILHASHPCPGSCPPALLLLALFTTTTLTLTPRDDPSVGFWEVDQEPFLSRALTVAISRTQQVRSQGCSPRALTVVDVGSSAVRCYSAPLPSLQMLFIVIAMFCDLRGKRGLECGVPQATHPHPRPAAPACRPVSPFFQAGC